jgi:hypothetical protein
VVTFSRRAIGIGVTVLATTVVAVAVAAAPRTGMMGGSFGSAASGPGIMGSAFGASGGGGAGAAGTLKPSPAQLTAVRNRIDAWLAASGFKGFTAAEVMAFTSNDYVAVHDPADRPAFELLTDLHTNWVMEEPPSMMWNSRYGVMGAVGRAISPMMGGSMMGGSWNGWYGSAAGKVTTTAEAVALANRWLAEASPGERVAADAGGSAMGKFPGYYTFDTVVNRETHGMLSVNASSGAVWYHGWHGTFLAEEAF